MMNESSASVDQGSAAIGRAPLDLVTFYRESGYVRLGNLFTGPEIAAMRSRAEAMIDALPAGEKISEKDVLHLRDPWFFRFLADPRVLDVVESFIGPDIALWSSHLLAQIPGDGASMPWHVDGGYLSKLLKPMKLINLGVRLHDSTLDTGCLVVAPGTQGKTPAMAAAATEMLHDISLDAFDAATAVSMEAGAGECHLHDPWVIHSSGPNVSRSRCCSFIMRFIPTDVVYAPPGARRDPIYLMRGCDRSNGQNLYAPVPSS
jgi:ectoine hydroxylase-related dioxygenase (phytanoyl-CoA dioxygenase family)